MRTEVLGKCPSCTCRKPTLGLYAPVYIIPVDHGSQRGSYRIISDADKGLYVDVVPAGHSLTHSTVL